MGSVSVILSNSVAGPRRSLRESASGLSHYTNCFFFLARGLKCHESRDKGGVSKLCLRKESPPDARAGHNRTVCAIEPNSLLHEQVDHERLRVVAAWHTSSVAAHREH